MTDKIIWQPLNIYGTSCDFGILLDYDFAQKMLNSKTTEQTQKRLCEIMRELIPEVKKERGARVDFENDSCLATGFYLNPGNGLWLTTNRSEVDSLTRRQNDKKTIQYYSHNVDVTIDQNTLLKMFDVYATYAEGL